MIYGTYGRTGKTVSRLGFGGMRFGKDVEESIRAMLRAHELGINYFDTAPGYCDDRSEKIFGEAFKRFDKARTFYVSTKSSSNEDPTAGKVLKRIETSLGRMNIPRIAFFSMWSIMSLDHFGEIRKKGGPLEGAMRAREEGLVEHVAFSTHAEPRVIAEVVRTGLFEGLTLSFNIASSAAVLPVIKEARALDVAVITMNPLGGGSLLAPAGHPGLAGALLRFNASFPEITVVLSGMSSVREVEENCLSLSSGDPRRAAAEAGETLEKLPPMTSPFCTACGYCMPCCEGIDIPSWMRAKDLAAIGRPDLAREVLRSGRSEAGEAWKTPDSCSQCRECEEKCTQHLDIVEALGKVMGLLA